MAKFILPYNISSTPQSLRDSPSGGTEDCIPQTPCVAPLRSAPIDSFYIYIHLSKSKDFV